MFQEFLETKKIKFEGKDVQDKIIFLLTEYSIPFGKYSNKVVDIGIPIPKDFPNSAPYGLHIKKNHGFEEQIPNRNPSPLGEDWNFGAEE